MSVLTVEVVTPEALKFTGQARQVQLPGAAQPKCAPLTDSGQDAPIWCMKSRNQSQPIENKGLYFLAYFML